MSDFANYLIHSNVFNFLFVVLLIVLLMNKLGISKIIENIKEEIKNYVESSEKERTKAQEELNIINDKIAKLPTEIEKIEESTKNSVINLEEQIRKDIETKKQDIQNNSERIFNLETKKFKQKLTSILSEKSVEIAKENAINQLNENKDLHEKYIDSAISELDRIVL